MVGFQDITRAKHHTYPVGQAYVDEIRDRLQGVDMNRYNPEIFEAICLYLHDNPGCSARGIGDVLFFDFHTVNGVERSKAQTHARKRDWTRSVLRVLESEGHVRGSRVGHRICYHLED